MDLSLLAPGYLWWLLLVPLLWRFPAGGTSRAALLRAVAMGLVVIALARPVTTRALTLEHHVLVVDRSAGLSAAQADATAPFAARWLEGQDAGARVSVLDLAAPGRAPLLDDAPERVRRSRLAPGTTLAEALQVAATHIPDGALGSVTLVGDGLDDRGGLAPIVQDLLARGLPVHVAPLAPRDTVRPVALEPLSPVRLGGTARLAVTLVGASDAVDVVLHDEGGEVARIEGLPVEGRTRALFSYEPPRAGFLPLTLTVNGAGVDADAATLARTLPVDEPIRALYLGREAAGAEALAALVGPGVRFDTSGGELDSLAGHDLVVLDDRPAEALPDPLCEAISQAVSQEGLGLFACGARSAFGAGGWQDTALAEVLPVEALQKEEKRDPSVALAIVIDTSGSMGGNRVQLAKEVARLSMRRLLPHDKVGIVEFYGAKRWCAPLQPASNNIELERALNRLAAGGGTVILPAIEEAFYGLLNVDARYKHVLVLTDGGVESGAFEPLLRRMADRGITTSTVLIGGDAHSEFLVTLANWGKGRFYAVPNRFNLPEVLFKQPTSAKLSSWRPGDAPLVGGGGPSWWGDLDPMSVPSVAGLVETELKPGATRVLETADGARPVLASWRYGLGRVTALPTEPTGPGSAGWDDWPDYGRFLARTLERTARDLVPFAFRVLREGHGVTLVAERRTDEIIRPAARLVLDGGLETGVAFEERAPGRFEARWLADPDEVLRLEAGPAGLGVLTRLVDEPSPARTVDPARGVDLPALAAASGGRVHALDGTPEPVAGGASTARDFRELRPWLLLLALAAYLFDVYDRRRAPRTQEIS